VKGEKAAWDAFVQQYSNLVYHTIRKTFSLYHAEPRNEAVDDLFQEFFHSLLRDNWKKLRQFRGDKGCSLARRGIGGVGKLGDVPRTNPASPESGSISVSTSHPYLWAPFILVGDGK
jgi:CHAT domain-containing protein